MSIGSTAVSKSATGDILPTKAKANNKTAAEPNIKPENTLTACGRYDEFVSSNHNCGKTDSEKSFADRYSEALKAAKAAEKREKGKTISFVVMDKNGKFGTAIIKYNYKINYAQRQMQIKSAKTSSAAGAVAAQLRNDLRQLRMSGADNSELSKVRSKIRCSEIRKMKLKEQERLKRADKLNIKGLYKRMQSKNLHP